MIFTTGEYYLCVVKPLCTFMKRKQCKAYNWGVGRVTWVRRGERAWNKHCMRLLTFIGGSFIIWVLTQWVLHGGVWPLKWLRESCARCGEGAVRSGWGIAWRKAGRVNEEWKHHTRLTHRERWKGWPHATFASRENVLTQTERNCERLIWTRKCFPLCKKILIGKP